MLFPATWVLEHWNIKIFLLNKENVKEVKEGRMVPNMTEFIGSGNPDLLKFLR